MSRAAIPIESAALAALPGLEFAPGTNPHGELALADWRFLLPTLRLDSVLFLGVPTREELQTLARTVKRIVVAAGDNTALQRLRHALGAPSPSHTYFLRIASPATIPCADGTFDLIFLGDSQTAGSVLRHPGAANELSRVLAANGSIYMRLDRRADGKRLRRWSMQLAAHGFAAPQSYWLLRRKTGGFQLACAVEERQAVQYAFDNVLYGISRRARVLRWIGRVASRIGLHAYLIPARAVLFHRAPKAYECATPAQPGPSEYLSAMSRRAGSSLENPHAVFFARGAYDSNKIAFFLFTRYRSEPEMLVKMTRSPRYNHRLETEHRALLQLKWSRLADPGTYPEPRFLDHHHDLAVLGQDVVQGAPFRTRARASAACSLAGVAIRWIEELGVRSVDPGVDSAELVHTLDQLTERFTHLYLLDAAERTFLRERIQALVAPRAGVPRVFQHGDAGTWNAFVTADGRVAFLDWEVARPRGVPLWDLLDFLQSFGRWAAHRIGERDHIRAYTTHFLEWSAFSELQAEAVQHYCLRVGVPKECVEPLFFACWMQRAVREAAWTSESPDDGFYVNLVRTCIRHRSGDALRRLFD